MLLLVGLVANLTLVIKLKQEVTSFQKEAPKRPSLPCAAIPTRFVMQEPVCAQKLIEAMHVTNVRVLTNESQFGGFDSGMVKPLGDANPAFSLFMAKLCSKK